MSADKQEFLQNIDVSRETIELLELYADELVKWTKRINLVSPKSLSQLWSRHMLDSAQLARVRPGDFTHWLDLGSGGGFPGMVTAILLKGQPNSKFTLVESDGRKAAFLRSIARQTGAAVTVIDRRIEDLEPFGADIVSARALASLDTLLSYADRHLGKGGRALFLKGQGAGNEIEEALEHWRFDCETYESASNPEGVILSIGDIQRV